MARLVAIASNCSRQGTCVHQPRRDFYSLLLAASPGKYRKAQIVLMQEARPFSQGQVEDNQKCCYTRGSDIRQTGPDIQALLPQIFIGNEVAFPAAAMDVSQKPVVVQYWHNKSSWNSVELIQRVLRELAASLAACSNLQPALIMDAASIHLHTSVLEQGMKSNIWLACVPAGLTWLLQPLDTHVFALYKAWLRNQFRALRSQGPVSCQQWLHLLGRGATTFLAGRRWRREFESAGMIGSKQRLSSALKEYFCEAGHGSAAPVPPSETDLQLILPRGRKTHRSIWTFKPSGRKRFVPDVAVGQENENQL